MSTPLSDSEIERLAARLSDNANADAYVLEAVDGLFCALIAGPALVPPSAYLPVILGGDPTGCPVFANLEDARDTLSLLMRYWNSIVADFRDETLHIPYMSEIGLDGIVGREWARGFLRGTRFFSEEWGGLFSDEHEGEMITIPLVAGELDPTWPKEPLAADRSDEIVQSLVVAAARAYIHFEEARQRRRIAARYIDSRPSDKPQAFPRIQRLRVTIYSPFCKGFASPPGCGRHPMRSEIPQ